MKLSTGKRKKYVTYAQQKKELLTEKMKLVYEREKLNKDIRRLTKSLRAWDKYLIDLE